MASPVSTADLDIVLSGANETTILICQGPGVQNGNAEAGGSEPASSDLLTESLWLKHVKTACWKAANMKFMMTLTFPPSVQKYNERSGKPEVPEFTDEQLSRAWKVSSEILQSAAHLVYGAPTIEKVAEMIPNLSDDLLQVMFNTASYIRQLESSCQASQGQAWRRAGTSGQGATPEGANPTNPTGSRSEDTTIEAQMDAARELSGDVVTDQMSLLRAGLPMFHQFVVSGANWDVTANVPERALFLLKVLEILKEPLVALATREPGSLNPLTLDWSATLE